MAGRREKLRRVGIIPEYRCFTPDGLASGDAIDMTVDELEVLRLCDLEGLNQEEVAQCMGIARATVAAICSRAHRKVANALVNGGSVEKVGVRALAAPVSDIRNQLIS
ncbi:DUF134 domain-containing protein [Collinsella aerofaciens]|uniref:DUF134 domain-containing protein n=1 Tax=Collinsella aerofaciens TaxID=74426 RepID=UPI0034A4205A